MEANEKQHSVFQAATGVSMNDLGLVIASLVVIAVFLWSAWVTLSYYEQWASKKNNVSFYDLIWSAARSVIILSLIIYIVN